MNCRVCDSELSQKYGTCSYCGYNNRAILTVENDDKEMYKRGLLKSIENLSVNINKFKYNLEAGSMVKCEEVSLFNQKPDGVQCSQSIIKSTEWIGHFDGTADLKVYYELKGKKKSVIAHITAKERKGIWYLGIHINENMRLELWLYVEPVDGVGKEKVFLLDTEDLDLFS